MRKVPVAAVTECPISTTAVEVAACAHKMFNPHSILARIAHSEIGQGMEVQDAHPTEHRANHIELCCSQAIEWLSGPLRPALKGGSPRAFHLPCASTSGAGLESRRSRD